MAYNPALADRVRKALAHLSKVEEKKMFGGLAFMVEGKMCITINTDRIMCRIDPAKHAEAIKLKGASPMMMKGREYVGYVRVSADSLNDEKAFNYWVRLAIEYNKDAKATAKRKPAGGSSKG